MKNKNVYYKIDELLKAAESFAREKNANEKLNRSFRKIEGKKQKIAQKNVTEVSHETLCEAMEKLSVCHAKVVPAIIVKFNELGYKAINKKVKTNKK